MKNKYSVVVASRSFSTHPILRKELADRYEKVTFNDKGRSFYGKELIEFLKGHDKAITALEKIDRNLIDNLPELKVISKYGVGLDMIDFQALEDNNVLLGWTGGVNKRSVSELVVSAAVSLLHCVPQANIEVRDGTFKQIRGRQLTGRTVGIIGCGHIGKDLVTLLKPFNCKILAHDIKNYAQFYEQNNVNPVSLDYLISNSDVVTLHLPLDETTINILNSKKLELIKPDSYLINIARGNLVDEVKLKEMLISGKLAGAALDVFSKEPPEDHELLNLPNVIATPHIGGSTEEAVLAMGRAAIEGLENAVRPSLIDT